jgi:hypothetical protein
VRQTVLGRIANGLFAAAGAACAAQVPAFYRQYLQHLSGRLAQAREDLAPIVQDAEARGMSVGAYLDKAAGEAGELTGTLVAGYRSTYAAVQRLDDAHAALSAAGPLERPLALARHFEVKIAQGTLESFGPALPLSAEGGAYALAGLLLGIAVLWTLERPVVAVARRRRTARAAAQSRYDSALPVRATRSQASGSPQLRPPEPDGAVPAERLAAGRNADPASDPSDTSDGAPANPESREDTPR